MFFLIDPASSKCLCIFLRVCGSPSIEIRFDLFESPVKNFVNLYESRYFLGSPAGVSLGKKWAWLYGLIHRKVFPSIQCQRRQWVDPLLDWLWVNQYRWREYVNVFFAKLFVKLWKTSECNYTRDAFWMDLLSIVVRDGMLRVDSSIDLRSANASTWGRRRQSCGTNANGR